ncbi:MAG: helix-turn-helix domain-containing protein [Chloroflexi bacterium]|nr:helix-turn-helix domain-containing protein [Chloroflexota bacterium]
MSQQARSNPVPAAHAAARLGVNASRVRALASSGQLPAVKVANRWLLDTGALDRRIANAPSSGRPFDPRKAWALLFLMSGEDAPWLSAVERSRARAIVRDREFEDVRRRLRRRAEVRYFAAGDRGRRAVANADGFVRSGVSAAEDYSVSLRSSRIIDGYLPRASAKRLIFRYAFQEVDERGADVVLRAADFWPLAGRNVAPVAAIAADLLDSLDERTVRAGRALADRLKRA